MSNIFWKHLFKVAKSILDFLLSALAERKGRLSIGRVLLISIFVLSMIKWSAGLDLPSSMLTCLLALLGYVLGTKVVSNVTGAIQNSLSGLKNGEVIKSSINTTVSSEGGNKTPDIED